MPNPILSGLMRNPEKKFREIVMIAPEVCPKNLVIETATRPSVTALHPAYSNLDRTASSRRKILKEASLKTTFEVLASFENQISPQTSLIQSSSIQSLNGHICLQTWFMKERAAALESGFQTDSVHGFIEDLHFAEVNVTFISAFCPIIQRTIPMVYRSCLGNLNTITKHIFSIF